MTRAHVRFSASAMTVDISEFDPVPCRMRLSMPGKSRLTHPVPGRPDGVDRNTDILVWCECMAQTWEQLRICREVRVLGLDPADVAWPRPEQRRGWDVLGAVSIVLPGTSVSSFSKARRANPLSTQQAKEMWLEHVEERAQRIAAKGAAR